MEITLSTLLADFLRGNRGTYSRREMLLAGSHVDRPAPYMTSVRMKAPDGSTKEYIVLVSEVTNVQPLKRKNRYARR